MSFPRVPFDGPYFDPTGLGFRPAHAYELNRRALTIVAICWNPVEREALFVNADGLALPLQVHPYAVLELLRRVVRVEYAKVIGSGQFAMTPGALKALEASNRIKQWVVYYLPQPGGYANDADTWAAYVAADLEAERKGIAESQAAALQLRCMHTPSIELPWPDTEGSGEAAPLESEMYRLIERRRAELESMRREWLASDARINAWLRGDVGDPPLLALMKGAA